MCQIPARGLTVRFVGFNTALLAAADDDRSKLGIGSGALSQAFLHPAIGPNEVGSPRTSSAARRLASAMNRRSQAGCASTPKSIYRAIFICMTPSSLDGRRQFLCLAERWAGHADGHDPVHGYNLSGLYVTETGRVVLRVWPRCWDRRGRRR